MRLELTNNRIMKDCFDTISRIIDEIVLECDAEGIRLHALDRSHITFVEMDLRESLFDDYNCDEPEKIMVDAGELMKVLKRCKPKDRLFMESDESKLILKFEGDSTRTFKISLIDSDYESQKPPELNHKIHLKIPVTVLEDGLEDTLVFGESVQFLVDEDYFICKSNNDMGDTETKYIHGEHVSDVVGSTFNIKKIKDMLVAKKLSREIILGLGDDMPLTLRFDIGLDDGYLSFLLAPRLEEGI